MIPSGIRVKTSEPLRVGDVKIWYKIPLKFDFKITSKLAEPEMKEPEKHQRFMVTKAKTKTALS